MEKTAIILWFRMMRVLSKIVTAMFVTVQTWALIMLFFVYFLAFWSSFAFLQPCGWLEGGIILGVMHVMLVPYTPSLSKFVESLKLAFLFINGDVFFFSSCRLAHLVCFSKHTKMSEGECLMFWVFCLVHVENFSQCILGPYP
jgi:hypothetical protein